MKTVQVKSLRWPYRVVVGNHIVAKTGPFLKSLRFSGKILIVTQKRFAKGRLARHLYLIRKSLTDARISNSVSFLEDGERIKSQKDLFRLYHEFSEKDFERRDGLLALGGGVIGDLTGYAAATYLRGIALVHVPTTLLAQVDSSVGGKTAINLPEGKNLVGAFYPPRLVISDVAILQTMPVRELETSMAEVVKYGMIRSGKLFRFLEKKSDRILAKDAGLLEAIVAESVRIKARVVSRDEFEEKGERMILNYGHTFGHAFEKLGHFQTMTHGRGVSLGMVCAARLARLLGMVGTAVESRQRALLEALHLPVSFRLSDFKVDRIVDAMMKDKKKRAGQLRFVLPEKIGKVAVVSKVPISLVRRALLEVGKY